MVFVVLFFPDAKELIAKMPRVGRNNKRENEVRRIETRRRRTEKVMINYIKTMHPYAYDEASKYYTELNKRYPDKLDLTKTSEFDFLLHNKVVTMNNLELKIKLMDHGKQTKTTATTSAEEIITPDPQGESVPPAAQEITVDQAGGTVSGPELLPMDDETLNQLIVDLQEDPDIASFFNNLDSELDECPLW